MAVETYKVLLQACDSRFAQMYAQELLVRFPKRALRFAVLHQSNDLRDETAHLGSVIGSLMSNTNKLAQRWGIELLLIILKNQDSAELIIKLDKFVPLLCELAVSEASRSDTNASSVSAIALQCLLEHVRLCSRISYIARHMDGITAAVLSIIDVESDSAIAAYESSKSISHDEHQNILALGKLSIGARIGGSPPCQAAVLIFKEIGATTQDSVESRNITEYWINFMEKDPSRWSQGSSLEVGLGVLRDSCKLDHQKYALACSLTRHLANLGNTAPHTQKAAILKVILSQTSLLSPTDTSSLLLLTIRSMSRLFNDSGALIDNDGAYRAIYDAVCAMAIQTNSRSQVESVIEASLGHIESEQNALGILYLCEAASSVYLDIPLQKSEDCSVTETMVTSIHALSSKNGDSVVRILKSLNILRHTFEATAPGSQTSGRCARALVAYLWTLLGSPLATPAIFIAVQGVYRALTETKISSQEGRSIITWFLASLNGQLVAYPGSADKAFCTETNVPPSQVTAAATIAHGMWECLKNSTKDADNALFESLKPVMNTKTDAQLLHINAIDMAVAGDDVAEHVPFTQQPVLSDSVEFTCTMTDDPAMITKKICGAKAATHIRHYDVAQGHIQVASSSSAQAIAHALSHVTRHPSQPSSVHHPDESQGDSNDATDMEGTPVEQFASGADALVHISRHMLL